MEKKCKQSISSFKTEFAVKVHTQQKILQLKHIVVVCQKFVHSYVSLNSL